MPQFFAGEKILVVQTSFLGDVVLTTPVFSEIRSRFPKAWLAVLCKPEAKPLLEGNPDINEIIVDDKRGTAKGLRGLWRKAADLRQRGFSVALSPHKSFRTALLLFAARIPFRVGFRQSAGWFLYHSLAERDPDLHDVERNLSILKPLGVGTQSCHGALRVEVLPGARESVDRLFASLGIGDGRITFGLNPGSVWPTKRWLPEGYAELMVSLKRKYSCDLCLFGGPGDQEITDRIQRLSGNLGINLAGKLSLAELACAFEKCDLLITNDSGPMHIAVARQVPVVAIFCATTPSLGFYPYSSAAVVVEKNLPCRPCSSHGGRRCPLGTGDCMRLIKAEDVLKAVDRLLNGSRRGAQKESRLPEFLVL
ncbi:MAG: lipopolysaccharide heptosyltransferase II [Deltaproteobacteria bacterium]|nr:lipopolysaccharide heptosyltransferase II [Deltaproteobacteria bacterium]